MMNLYDQKMNALMLARHIDNNPFHLYLTKPITSADLTGLKLRITPVYPDFFQAQGATVVQTAPGEVYTSLERGVVDGYGWPITGIFDLGWHEKTKYRVDPGFYSAEVSVLINKATLAKLNEKQKKVLMDAAEWLEAQAAEVVKENVSKRPLASRLSRLARIFRTKACYAGWGKYQAVRSMGPSSTRRSKKNASGVNNGCAFMGPARPPAFAALLVLAVMFDDRHRCGCETRRRWHLLE
jgi:hypothetical protein